MDYGQTQKQPDFPGGPHVSDVPQDFFTVGAGTNSEDLNDVNPEDNLDLSNNQASWGPQFMQMPPENITEPIRDISNIETPPIPEANSTEKAPKPTSNTGDTINRTASAPFNSDKNTPELGKIAPTNPQVNSSAVPSSESDQKAQQYFGIQDLDSVVTSEGLTHQGMAAINNAEVKLSQDGDAASFYENFEHLREQVGPKARNLAGGTF